MAGRIRSADVEEVRRKASIVDIAAEYMQVRKAGSARFKALCPFHTEKTPSFSIDAAKGLYHCFGCQKGGDVITLVQELEGLSFVEAVERLSAKVGVTLTYERASAAERQAATRKMRLIAAHRDAVAFYHDLLMGSPEAKPARDYLRGRGLEKETVEGFRLGWSPSRWDELCRYLLKRRFSENELLEAGLALRSERGGLIDRFRGRIMFPTFDLAGEPIGFGGRVLDVGTPKYLNTADTPIHQKGRVLYGLNWAKQSVVASGHAIVVEGYMDVIALHQAGVREAVATNGTALGLEHFRLLSRFSQRTIVAFDSDQAGAAAVERAFDHALASGTDARVLILPDGKDPADFVTERGAEEFRGLIQEAVPLVEYRLTRELSRFDVDEPEGRTRALRAVLPILARMEDEVMRREYARRVAGWTRVDPDVVFLEMDRAGRPGARPAPEIRRTSAEVRLERDALKLALQYPAAIGGYRDAVEPDTFSVAAHRAIWRAVEGEGPEALGDRLTDEEARGIVTALTVEPVEGLEPDGTISERLVAEIFTRLKEFALRRQIQEKKDRLQRLNPLEREDEYRDLYAELIALEGERRRVSGVLAETGAE